MSGGLQVGSGISVNKESVQQRSEPTALVLCPSELRSILNNPDSSIRDEKLGAYVSRLVNQGKLKMAQEALSEFSSEDYKESSVNEVVGGYLARKNIDDAERIVKQYGVRGRTEGVMSIIADAYIGQAQQEKNLSQACFNLDRAMEICNELKPDLNRDFQFGTIGLRAAELGENSMAAGCVENISDRNVRDDVFGALAVYNKKVDNVREAKIFCQIISNTDYRKSVSNYITNKTKQLPEIGAVLYEGKRLGVRVSVPRST